MSGINWLVIAALVVVLGAGGASAVDKAKKDPTSPKTLTKVPSDVYAKYDINNNGTLDPAEKEAIKKDFAANPADSLLKPYDKNNDGKLSADEIMGIPANQHVDPPAKPSKPKQSKPKKK